MPARHARSSASLDRQAVASPSAWRADAVARTAGIVGQWRLEQAIANAAGAGLFDRRAGDAGLVFLTERGRAAQKLRAAGQFVTRR